MQVALADRRHAAQLVRTSLGIGVTMRISRNALRAIVVGLFLSLPRLAQAQSTCASPGTGMGLKLLQVFKQRLAATDTAAVLFRVGFGLTGVDSAAVTVVTDTAVCSRVTASIDSAFADSTHSGPFVVIQAGPYYIAYEANAEPQSMYYVDRATYAYRKFTPG